MLRFLKGLFESFVVLAIVAGVLLYFYGETTVSATLDGKSVRTQVWVDGQYAGETPYKAYLGPGHFKISVLPPDDVDTTVAEWEYELVTGGVGKELDVTFASAK